MTDHTTTTTELSKADKRRVRRDYKQWVKAKAQRPECPEWCLPQNCAVTPKVSGGHVWGWDG